jgi:hypothetical protein
MVTHNLELLTLLQCHYCLEIIHSDQCIGYILKYCSKKLDTHPLDIVRYEGFEISKRQQLEYYAGSRIYSAVECFAAISGDRRHHLNLFVGFLTVYLENQRIVLIHHKTDVEERLNQSSRLERYFDRSQGQEYDNLTYTQYFSLF